MTTGAITGYIDVAQLTLYAFWIFFAALIIYLRREDKREGYPLEGSRNRHNKRVRIVGWPAPPPPKTFKLAHGGSVTIPERAKDDRAVAVRPVTPWPGSPYEPTGDPMLDGVGPGAYAERSDVPDLTLEGTPKIVPLKVATDFGIVSRNADPRGMFVVGADGKRGGSICDVWVDRSEPQARYLEIETTAGRHVLVPVALTRIDAARHRVIVRSILGSQFEGVPAHRNPGQVTRLEEERISTYYGAGTLYAEESRQEPFL